MITGMRNHIKQQQVRLNLAWLPMRSRFGIGVMHRPNSQAIRNAAWTTLLPAAVLSGGCLGCYQTASLLA